MRFVAICLFLLTLCAPRPATAEPRFREVSRAWGVDFRHHHGGSGKYYMVETAVGGVVVFDYDGDGDADLFFVDGGSLPGYEGEPARSRLFRNDSHRFVDVTRESGIEIEVYGSGATAGDVDGDGDLDLYVTAFGPNRLLINQGDGTFRDATDEAQVGDPLWSMSATFFDADGDGDLDLYVANYVDFTLANHKFCGDPEAGIQAYCHPDKYNPLPDRFYRNRGDGTFVDATADAGFGDVRGAGLGVVAGDVDEDGQPDLYVANDLTPNFLFHNRGDGTFEDISLLAGVAYSEAGRPEAGMGVELGDLDGDGRPDLVVTNFELETNAVYVNMGAGLFLDQRFATGVGEPSLRFLGFGVVLADFDNDGDLDLAVANGHTNDTAALLLDGSRYAQPNQLFVNGGGGRFGEVHGVGFDEEVRVSRGLACGDLDRDGDLDLVVANSNSDASLFENLTGSAGSWLQVTLRASRGEPWSIGARVEIDSPTALRQVQQVRTSSSYLSQNELALHFGLGQQRGPVALDVQWRAGGHRRLLGVPAGARVLIAQ
jgi:hypothetical protein